MDKIYIFGHRFPDTDSITSAIALEYLTSLCFENTVDGLWSYYSQNIHVDLLKIPKNGNINIDEKIKSLKIDKHEPYIQFGNCLNSIKSIDNSEYINLQFINMRNSYI